MYTTLNDLMDPSHSLLPRVFTLVDERLRMVGNRSMPSTAAIVLTHGRLGMQASTLPAEARGPSGRCYVNSLLHAIELGPREGNWSYCEGYAYQARFDVLFEHAWLINDQGHVLDPTWPSVDGCVYLGVSFPTDLVATAMQEEAGGLIFGDYARDFRLHREHQACCGEPRRPGFNR